MENELKPCPFCQSQNLSIVQHGGGCGRTHYVRCNDCNSHGPWVKPLTRTGAINIWNTRPNQEDLAEAVELIREVRGSLSGESAVTDKIAYFIKRQGGGDTSFTPISNGSDYEGEI